MTNEQPQSCCLCAERIAAGKGRDATSNGQLVWRHIVCPRFMSGYGSNVKPDWQGDEWSQADWMEACNPNEGSKG